MAERIDLLGKILKSIPPKTNIAVFPHAGVDADCLGSAIAISEVFKKLGNDSKVVTESPIPEILHFMPGIEDVSVVTDFEKSEKLFPNGKEYFSLMIDCSEPSRLGSCAPLYNKGFRQMVIDHHLTVECHNEYCCIDPSACASGELVYDFIILAEKQYKRKLTDYKICYNIYAAIFSDTGGFRYSNTNARAFGISEDIFMEHDIDSKIVSYNLFEKTSLEKIKLESKAYEAVEMHLDDKIAISVVTLEMIEQTNALETDIDGICSNLVNIDGVVVAIVLRQRPGGEIKGNIRSSEDFDASAFALELKGGGHMRAAGFSISDMTIHEVRDKAVEIATKIIKKQR